MNKQKKFNQQNSKLILEELEERRLFSGGIEGLIVSDLDSEAQAIYADLDTSKTQTDSTRDQTSTSAAEEQTQEIVFVDEGVDNYQQLIDDLRNNSDTSRNIEVVLLDRDQDGIEQISAVLQDREDLDAVHIISHGSDGSVELGNTSLDAYTLEQNNLNIGLWANAFAETGDILIYGCNLAGSGVGQSLIADLSDLTLADVAASDDLTGAAALGGDWQLEFKTGSIETSVALDATAQADYEGVFDAYEVSNTNATGAGSLHQAILDANANTGVTDTINFNIGTGPQTIAVDAGGLPIIEDPIILDATTQPGYSGTPLITLDGSATPPSSGINGITLRTNDSTVKGFIVINFADEGIEMDGSTGFGDNNIIQNNWVGIDKDGNPAGNAEHGIMISADASGNQIGGTGPNEGNVVGNNGFSGVIINENSDNNIVEGNIIGLLADGTTPAGNGGHGVLIQLASDNNRIGGTTANSGNVISGNSTGGIYVDGSTDATHTTAVTDTTIQGNLIGTDVTGTVAVSNLGNNININQGATNTLVGGAVSGAGNVIAAATNDGITIWGGGTTGTIVQGNYIGTDTSGVLDLGNANAGVVVSGGSGNNQIGGTAAGEGNIVAFNNDIGVEVRDFATVNNAILGNSIYSNTLLGIDLGSAGTTANDVGDADNGASNNLQNFPVLSSAETDGSQIVISGNLNSVANSFFRIEFFTSTGGPDQTYLGFANVATDGSGNAIINATLTTNVASGALITATATASDITYTSFADTSEFSANVTAGNSGTAIWRDASTTPQTSDWDGTSFGSTTATAPSGDYRIMQGAEAPTRDEIIIIGVDESSQINGEIWDGSSWSVLPSGTLGSPLGTVSQNYWWSMDVAYEQQSGDAVMVWADGTELKSSVWDGSNWSVPVVVNDFGGSTPRQIQLAAQPNGDEMVMVVSDSNGDDTAWVWDGSGWTSQRSLDTNGGNLTSVYVSYEQQSGDALVTYAKSGDANVYYQIWDGTSWSTETSVAPPGGVTSAANWVTLGSDPGSDRIVMGVVTSGGTAADIWLSVWNGTSWEASVEAETTATGSVYPNVAVAFESTSGQALAAYGEDGSNTVKYRTWDSGSGWSTEQIGPDIGGEPNSLILAADPISDQIMLSAQDANSHVNYVLWDGGGWGTPTELGTSTTEVKNQPFLFLWDQNPVIDTDSPVIDSDGGGSTASVNVAENTTAVTTVSATDPQTDPITYAIAGGADAALFSIDPNGGALSFITAPDYENPGDVGLDNIYQVTVQASDGSNTDTQTISVTVTDADDPTQNDAPTNSVPGAQSIEQNGILLFSSTTGTAISIADPDAGGASVEVTLSATNGTLSLPSAAGLLFSNGDGTAATTMTFTGTIADINAALEGMTFVATPGFTGSANLQITTDDLGNTGTGGALTDTDNVAINVAVPDHTLWMTFENDESTTGNAELPDFTGGDVVNYGGTLTFESGATSGTFSKNFNLDLITGTDGDTSVDAVHYVTRDISVGGIDLQAGDLLLSTAATEVIDGVTYNKEDVFVFRPTTTGDYGSGSFFMLIEAKNSGLLGNTTGISLVEQETVVGGVTLNAGDFLIAEGGKEIIRFEADQLGATPSGTTSILVQGADIDIGQNIGALHLVQEDTAIGDSSLQAGQLIMGLVSNDSTVGDTPTINVLRQDLFLLDVNATGDGTTAATATRFFEGLDENLDGNNESIWGVSLQYNVAPSIDDALFALDENSANSTVVGSVTATDAESGALNYAITAGNTDGAFTIDATTGQISVANSAALDFETNKTFQLEVVAIDDKGAYDTATVAVNLNNLDEAGTNDAPENTIPVAQTIDKDGMLLFSSSTGTTISISDFDAGGSPLQVTLAATNGTINLSGTNGLTFSSGDGNADASMIFTGTIADINAALEGATFVATPGFTGSASLQITTDDLGNTGTGGALTDTDNLTITVQAADDKLWLTFENDEAATGNDEIPSITGGDVVTFGDITQLETSSTDPLASITSGTLAYGFNLDTVLLSDGLTLASDANTIVNAVHYVTQDIQVGSNNIQLQTGDILLSTDADEDIEGVTYNNDDVFVFRPDTPGDYSQGSFFLLIDGNAASLGLNNITGLSMVEQTTTVGGMTLNAGEFLFAHDGSGKNILHYTPGTLGATTTGTASVLIAGADIDFGQNIGGIHLIQNDTVIGGVSVSAGQLLVSLQSNDTTVGDAPTIDVLRQDIFVLDVTATGDGTTAATATRFFEGLDENLDGNNESIWGIGYQGNVAPTINADSFAVDENSVGATVVGSVTATDPELGTLSYAITAGNTNGAFAIDATSGQITVANSAMLDFETTPVFTLTVAAIDPEGTYTSATITINLNDLVENQSPTDLVATTTTNSGVTMNSDGGNDVYFVADNGGALLGGLTTVTIETTFSISTPVLTYAPLLSYADGSNDEELAILLEADGTIRFGANSNGSPLQDTTGTYTQLFDGNVHHVGVSWDSSTGAVDFYVDGALVESFSGYQTGQPITGGGELVFGQEQDSVLGSFNTNEVFSGTLYDIRIFDDIRTQGEVAANYDQTLPNTEAGMIANWVFDDLSVNGVITETVSGNNLTQQQVVGAGFTTSVAELNLQVAENPTNGTVVGNLATLDPDSGDTFTYSLQDDAGGRFTINASTGQITVADGSLIDFETAGSHNITVRTTDAGGLTYDEVFTISVANINEAPVVTSDGGQSSASINVAENTTAITTVTATDVDLDTPTFTISGGVDQGLFSIDLTTGVLTFDTAPDFENPGDVGADNTYAVEVTAADGNGGFDVQIITVQVTNAADGIRVTPLSVVPLGGETLVNTNTTDNQMISANVSQAVATDASGNYVIVWGSNLQDGSGWGIFAQQYNADGTTQGSEFLVNTVSADNQLTPSVAMDAAGNFTIVWQSNLQDGDSYGVYAQQFNAAGVAQGTEFLVNTTTTGYQGSPGIAMAANGDFVINWVATEPDTSLGIYAQLFNASGVAQGGEIHVNTYTAGHQQATSVAMSDQGNFVITWASQNQDGSNYGVFGQLFDASGNALGAEFQVNTTTVNSQLYNDVAMLADGRFVVEYQSRNADGSFEVYMQRYDANGTAVGSEIQVNTTTVSSAQQPIGSITADDSGNITVVWNNDADGDGTAVVGRSFDWDGNPLSAEFQINSTVTGNQLYPEVVALPGGGFIAVWGGEGTGDADGVYSQRYGLSTDEDGGTTSFQVVLESAPSFDVTIPISVSDGSEGSVSLGSLTFNSGNWNIPQFITVTGIQDFILDGDQTYTVNIGPVTSADLNFNGLDPADLTIINLETNAPPVITSDGGGTTASINVVENSTAVTTVTATDVDLDTPTYTITGGADQGLFSIDLNSGVLTFDSAPDFETPGDVGANNSYEVQVTAADGLGGIDVQTITVTVTNAGEAPVFGGADTGAVTEDVAVVIGNISDSGSLIIADPDAGESSFQAATINGTYGDLTIDTAGNWSYSADNSQAAIQTLDNGESLIETLTITAFDGTTHDVVITINGAEDTAVIGGTATGAVAEDGTLTATDTLTITDVDTNDNPVTFNDVAATIGGNGYGNFEITGNTWTYTLNNGHASVQALDVGQTLNDTFTFTASDGSTQIVTVTINGAEDAAVIGGTAVGAVAEDGTLTATDTLTITDVDTNDNPVTFNDVAATIGGNGYGNFEIASNTWTYTLNNAHAAVQALDVGQTLNDTFTFTASDGSTQVVTVTINGAEDGSVIGGMATGAVAEDGTLTATDTLTITDVDTNDNPVTFNDVAATIGGNGYGNFEITAGTWTYTLNNAHAAVQALDVGQTLNDTFTFTASDGSTQVVTVTINGAEDAAVIGGTAVGAVAEDGTLTATDTLTITDVDTNDNPISFNDVAATIGDSGYGNFEITGNTWTYTLNNGHAAVQALDVGQTLNDTFTFTASDGSTQVVTVTISGAEDAAVIGGTAVGAVAEDGTLTATDTLTITDVDTNDNPISFNDVADTIGDNGYGNFEITAGTWTYTLNNGHAAVQALDVGQTLNDTFTFTASDGSTQVVTVTINGAEDAAVIGGTAVGAVAEDGTLTATDTLTITDVDTNDNPISFSDVAATIGDNGYGSFEITGNTWTYSLNNGHAAVQALDVGQTLNDTFTFTASDGSTQVVTVTINGAEDGSVIGGTATGAVAEDGTLTATDTLTITDVDTNDNPISFNDVAATLGDNGYGNFEINGNTWTYTLNNAHAAVQALDVGQTLNDTFTFTASDGSTQVVTVMINGAEDGSVIGGTATGAVAEDGTLTATDTLTITDVDTNDNPISFNDVAATIGDNGYGNFEITGNTWTFTLNNGHASVQALDVGQTLNDTFTFTASDGSTQVVTVTINGAEDAAVIGGTAVGAVAEDGTLTATDTLTITDVDTSDNPISFNDVVATIGGNGYGNFEITGNTWTYTLNNAHASVQALDVGQTLNDTFTFTASDGSTQVVTVTINGAEDGSVIGGTAIGAVAEDGTLTATDTLTITDVDTNDNPISFNDVAATIGGNGYGNFEITAGTWTYTLNNAHAAVQALDVGQTLNDTFTFTASDGSTQIVTVTINGAEDGSVIGGTAVGAVTEDGTLTATDTLTITDVDTNDNPISFNDVAATIGGNGYGNFEITAGTWTYTLNNAHAAVQALDVGQTLNDTFTFTASDGSTQVVTVTINGAEDAAVIGGTAVGAVAEDGTLTATDTLTITDVDTNDNPISFNDVAATIGGNGYGNFEITAGTWTYTLNNGHAAVQALDVGQTLNDIFTFTASDGSTQVVTVTINGAEDGSVIGGTAVGAVSEDGTLTATDTLTITDVDTNDNPVTFNDVAATIGGNGYGNFEITGNTWTYTLNNGHAAIQALDVGQTLNDTFTFTASDGSTQVVTVTINGAEDAAVIGGTAVGAVAEDGTLTATDTLTITDVDTNDNPISFNDVAATIGDNGYGNFEITGNTWTYTLNNGLAAVQALDVGETLTDTHTFTATDGSTQVVTITINGTEDAPVFDSTAVIAATEDTPYSYTINTSDVDIETVTITAPTLPDWLTLVDNGNGTATLSGTPTNAEVGSHNVVLNVSDGTLSSNQNFTIVVSNINDPAVIAGVDTGAIQEDVAVSSNDISTTGLLTITDPDAGESSFQATTINGTYGDLTIDTAGNWTYIADNTQAAIQQLDVTEFLTDTLTVTSFDGTTHNVVITINGSEDTAVIGGTAVGAVAEDGTLTATDTLTITDIDTNDNPVTFNDVAATIGANGYGNFEITAGTWTYTLNNAHASVQALDVGQTLNDTFTFTASDGSTQVVTVTINGAEDGSVIGGTATGAVAEDGTLTATDTLTITDVDTNDNPISFNDVAATIGGNGYGNFEITAGTWTYTLNNGHAAVQALDVGQTLNDTFTFTASDGSTQVVTVTINGAEDGSVIGGTAIGAVAEDGTLTATDTLTITDVDSNDNPISFNDVAATIGDNGYGSFEITAGTWTYTLNNGHAAVQALDVGQTLNDTFTFTASDGSTQVVTVAINGAEDGSVIGGTAVGAVAEDGTLIASDSLTITDVDSNDNPISFNDVAATIGDNGYGNFEITGNTWTYTLNNGHASVQALDVGQTLNDTFTFTASDGSTQVVTVTINGAEDGSVIGGTAVGAVAEDGTLTATDTLTITDVDSNDNPINFNDVVATIGDNGYGNFEITGNTWTYTLNNGHASVQALDVGQTLNDTFTFTASDGSTQVVTVTINGAEDGSVIGGTAVGAVAEDGTLTASDTLTITDVDTNDKPVTFNDVAAMLGDNGYGNFEITAGTWTYTLNNGHAAVQALDVGQTMNDTFTFTASDGSTQVVTVTINGAEDAAVIGGTAVGAVAEDGTLTATATLTITDVDTNDNPVTFNDVAATIGNNGYGNFEITGNTWTYTLNSAHASVQALDVGQTMNDTFTFTASDGSTQVVTVTINGAEDGSVIGGTAVGNVAEDGTLTATDTLTITDVDTNDNPITFNDVVATIGGNGYGNFEITGNTWTYTLNNGHAAVQALDVGQTLNDTFTFTATDGSTQVVTVTINGAEDGSVIGGTAVGAVTEDGTLTATDTLTITDVDTNDNPISFNDVAATIGGNGYGNFEITGNTWTYTLNNGHAAVQALDVGQTLNDTFTFTASDGSTQVVTVTINGAEDGSVIGGTAIGAVAEDGTLTATDTLTITDVDSNDNPITFNDVVATIGDNGYGNFEITGNTWTYTLNNGHATVQALDVGQTLNDTFTFTASDGSTQVVTVTINGAEDGSVIGGTVVGAVAEDGTLTATDTLTITDVDTNDNPISFNDVAATIGDNGYGNFEITGNTWTYTLNNAHASVQALDVGQTLNDTFTFTASDGSTQVVIVTINGAEDTAVIGGTAVGAVSEDGTLTTTNTLTITDVDTNDNPISFNDVAATIGDSGYGNFEITGNTWTYTLNNGHASVQALDVGQTLNDTFTFTASDGSTQVVTVTINGAEDAAVIGGTAVGAVSEDGTLTATDSLTITDVDTNDNPISFNDIAATIGDNGYGNFEITGNTWTYTLNNAHASVQALDAGQSLNDTFTFIASDGSTQVVTVTINGAEDGSVIGGTAVGAVAEDGTLTATDTLTITDVDTNDNPVTFNDVAATIGDNGYGNFEITGNTWTYTLNNAHASVQALDVGQTLNDTFTFTASDGSTQVVTVTINGAEDVSVIGGTATGTVVEDGSLTATNTLTITDVDTNDNPISFNDVAPTLGDNGYGNFEITGNTWTYTLNNGHASVQALDVGETLNDTFTFTASDGSMQIVIVTINGAEDAPVFDSPALTAATENVAYSYTITTSDVDGEALTITAPTLPVWLTFVDNGDGTATLSGTPSNAEVGSHNVVLNVSDGTLSSNQNFTIVVANLNNLPVIGGIDSATISEDRDLVAGNLTAVGALTIADPDVGESSFVGQTIQGSFGNLTINASGNWSYSADNGNPEIQALQTGDSFTETLTVTSMDGTTHDVVITINGTTEAPPAPPPPEPPPDDEPPVDEPPDEGEEEQGGIGEDPILEEITAVPQGTSPPAPEEDSSFAQPDEPESEPVDYGPAIDKQTAKIPEQPQPQALQAQNLSIDTLTLQVSDDEALNEQYELELLGRIDSMHLGMDDEAAQQNADDVNVQIFVGSTASLTVGIVSWVLRGGALLASFMSTVPLLNRFDPLPILKAREDEEDVEPDDDDDEKTQVREHARKVDNMFSGKGDSQQ